MLLVPASCESLQDHVKQLLELVAKEPTLRIHDVSAIQTSLRQAIAPRFEVVFAGAFSAGKSMLINALLERKLLYSAEGHATGTECQIAYAEANQERVVLTFLSQFEIMEQARALIQRLGLMVVGSLEVPSTWESLQQMSQSIIQEEGGENRSERAKQASALNYLLEGWMTNRDRIQAKTSSTYSMEQLNFTDLQAAASYARRGANSAVLKRIEYYCHDDLLKDGNIFVDTPGIDAPVRRDAELTYGKIQDPDTSAVICVLKAAETGELTSEETELLETIRDNPGIRDRVFYVFNRIDKTWYSAQLRQRLEKLLQDQFQDSSRIYKTSGLLGFYGSQLKSTNMRDRFGLDSLFSDETQSRIGKEEAPLFVTEFNNYCGSSGKLIGTPFRPEVRGYELPNENYVRILSENGTPLIDQLIQDSGTEEFRSAITRYLTEEKRPLLFSNLADDLQPVCIGLRRAYIEAWQKLESQPRDVAAIKEQELQQLSHDLKVIGDTLKHHIEAELNQAIASNSNQKLEDSFRKLQSRMVNRLDELLKDFSVSTVHQQAQASHKRNSVVPLLGILAEAFYYLANGLEDVLVKSSQDMAVVFGQYLLTQIREQSYYRDLYRFLGNDGGIEDRLAEVQSQISHVLANEARLECDRYVRERPEFYTEGTISIWQLRQTLQQTCRGYDYQSMVEAEAAIRQLLKLDFEQKVKETVIRTFRHNINQTLNRHLLAFADQQINLILDQYDHARLYLAQVLDKEAEERIQVNQVQQEKLKQNIDAYNTAIQGVNTCLEAMQCARHKLPLILESDLTVVPPKPNQLENNMIFQDDQSLDSFRNSLEPVEIH